LLLLAKDRRAMLLVLLVLLLQPLILLLQPLYLLLQLLNVLLLLLLLLLLLPVAPSFADPAAAVGDSTGREQV